MIGVLVNFLTVIAGGILGTLIRGGLKENYSKTITSGLGLCVLVIGISGAIKTSNIMIVIISTVIGCVLGELLKIETGLDHLGEWAQKTFSKGDSGFATGFVNATLLFSVGAMAIVGALEAGLKNNPDTLLAKSALDGVSAMIFASSFGIGAAFAAIPMTIYQGTISLFSGVLRPFLTEALINEMSAVGSLLIIGLGINMLGMTKERIRVGNMLPAILIPCIYFAIMGLI